jgi:hypothetical protein
VAGSPEKLVAVRCGRKPAPRRTSTQVESV